MIEQTFSLIDFIEVTSHIPKDTGWPTPSPFNLRFKRKATLTPSQTAAITGTGIYLISSPNEVAYLGSYRPMNGDILADRFERHLETITGRGYRIGLGGKANPNKRKDDLLSAIAAPDLRQAILSAFDHSRDARFKDTGVNTTPNRLRFASENWQLFGAEHSSRILAPLTIQLLRIRPAASQEQASREVRTIEKMVLETNKPLCNKEYLHSLHEGLRASNTAEIVIERVRQTAHQVTGSDITYSTLLMGRV